MNNMPAPSPRVVCAALSAAICLGPTGSVVAAWKQSDNMTDAVRATLTMGARYLLDGMETTNGWTWALQPYQVPHGSVHVRSVTNYYSYKEVDEKVYKYEKRTVYYEEYDSKMLKPPKSPGDPPIVVTVKKQRRLNSPAEAQNPRYVKKHTVNVRVGDPIGTRKVKQLVADPNGTIQKVHQINSSGEADYWPTGFLGQNAMALLALLKCGIPEDDEQLRKLIDTLNGAVRGYRLPDTTWDLAWLGAAFANLKSHHYEQTRDMLIDKLIDGQIKDGDARGLWGPVCVNTEMLGKALAYQQSVSARVEIGGKKDKGEAQEKAMSDLEYIGDICRTTAQQGLRFSDIRKYYVLGINGWIGQNDVIIEGLPLNLYRVALADIESTGLVLFALREAAANGVLPEETKRPETKRGSPYKWPPPEKTSAVLARCAAALSKLVDRAGKAQEANMHQPCTEFARIAMAPLDTAPLGNLPNPVNPASCMRAYAALLDTGHAIGMETMARRYAALLDMSDKQRRELVDMYLKQSPELKTSGYCDFLDAEFWFKASGIQRHYLGTAAVDDKIWRSLAVRVARTQGTDGSWPKDIPEKYLVKTTSEWHAAEVWERAHIAEETKKAKDRGKRVPNWPEPPDDSVAFWQMWLKGKWFLQRGARHQKWRAFEDTIAPTCYAMLFLADAEPASPAVTYIADKAGEPAPRILSTAAHLLAKNKKATIRCVAVTPAATAALKSSPLAFLSSPAALDDEKFVAALKTALASGMMLVIDGPNAANAKVIGQLTRLISGKFDRVPANTPSLSGVPVEQLKLEGIIRPDGTTAVLLLPWRTGTSLPAGVLSGNQALQITAIVLTSTAEKQRTSGALVVDPNTDEDMAALKMEALARLTGVRTPPAVQNTAPAEDKQKDAPPVEDAPPAPKPPPLKEDEVW